MKTPNAKQERETAQRSSMEEKRTLKSTQKERAEKTLEETTPHVVSQAQCCQKRHRHKTKIITHNTWTLNHNKE